MKVVDVHTYAKPDEAVVTHLDWEAKVDFDQKIIEGKATLSIKAADDASEIILDANGLKIEKVTLGDDEVETEFSLGEDDRLMGQPLKIKIEPDTKKVNVYYSTTEGAQALQWLTPEQTADKTRPFLFTQSQAILARSWIPIQDSPGIRFTYTAKVTVPNDLLALMSANNPQEKNAEGVYHFEMKQPIPAYLMALSVGDVSFKSLGERTGVYAESSVVEAAAYEFAELEDMVKVAESLYGPYQWERYDLIVLPPSFPFGGMENPRLTFATPTILAGDRSLTSLVAHELAHSWSGNLVTNATWDDFWINEGFTVYFEHRIMEALYGRDYSEMLASLSLQGLKDEIEEMINEGKAVDTHLKLNLKGRSPDEGVTAIAYDKGYFFLRFLEEKVGKDTFDVFLKEYFSSNAFKVMTTEGFIEYMDKNLFKKNGLEADKTIYEQWIYGPGLPADSPIPVSDRFTKVDEALTSWQNGTAPGELATSEWSSHEWLHFIRALPEDIAFDQMKALDSAFGFTASKNSEVFSAWMIHAIRHQYEDAYDELEAFLIKTGRRKFLSPIYGEMIKTEAGKQMALRIYEKARPNYHFVSTNTLDEMLGLSEGQG
ncbi:MAG: M1 family metallopeptidase [Bacteroidota bacterium]